MCMRAPQVGLFTDVNSTASDGGRLDIRLAEGVDEVRHAVRVGGQPLDERAGNGLVVHINVCGDRIGVELRSDLADAQAIRDTLRVELGGNVRYADLTGNVAVREALRD